MKKSYPLFLLLLAILTIWGTKGTAQSSDIPKSAKQQDAETLYYQGDSLYKEQDYPQAIEKIEEARSLFAETGDGKGEALALNFLGTLYRFYHEDYPKAEECLERAIAIAEELQEEDLLLESLMEKLQVHQEQKDTRKERETLIRLTALMENEENPAIRLKALKLYGDKALQNQDAEMASRHYSQALAIAKETGNQEEEMVILRKLFNAAYQKGDYDSALDYNQQVIDFCHEHYPGDFRYLYSGYNIRAMILMAKEEYKLAGEAFDSLLSVIDRMDNKKMRQEVLLEQSFNSRYRGDTIQALRQVEESDSLAKTIGLPGLPTEKCSMYLWAGEYPKAIAAAKEYVTLQEERQGTKSPQYVEGLRRLALCEKRGGETNEAMMHYKVGLETALERANSDLQVTPPTGRTGYWKNWKNIVNNSVKFALQCKAGGTPLASSVLEMMVFQKGMKLALEKSTHELLTQKGDSIAESLYLEIEDTRKALAGAEAEGEILTATNLYQKSVNLENRLLGEMKRLNIAPVVEIVRTEELAERLGKDEALVEFANTTMDEGNRTYAALILKKEMRHPALVELFEESTLDSLFCKEGNHPSRLYGKENSEAMRQLLQTPLESHLKGMKRVYFVPSGTLYQIALEAIEDEDGVPWEERQELVRLSSAKRILSPTLTEKMKRFDTALLCGTLTYPGQCDTAESGREDKRYSSLPYTKEEIEEIKGILTKKGTEVKVLDEEKGTSSALLDSGKTGGELLHLATHGFFYNEKSPNLPESLKGYTDAMYLTGLLMADGELNSIRISEADLGGTRLAVLSGCSTGLGEITAEGVYGLQRGFKKAGVETLLMSLWPVNDVVTKDFMIEFHRQLQKSGDKRKALRETKKKIRKEYPDPEYWAGFVLMD